MSNTNYVQINTSRSLCVNRQTAQEAFYQVDVGYGVIKLRKGCNVPIDRSIIDVNGNVGFKFKGNVYRTELTSVEELKRKIK